VIQAVIFDMDGVLVDSERFICEAAMRMFAEHGVAVQPEDFLPFVGAGENRYIGGPAEQHGFPLDLERDKARTYAIYDEIVRGRLQPLDGVHAFFDRCEDRGLRLALATAADEVKMLINLRELDLPPDRFDAIVHGLDVTQHKPEPEAFLLAAERLGVPPETCLVVEDAINGVRAAKNAGCRTLGLTTSFGADTLREAGADWTASTLADAPDAAISW
jgi:HAD superfamily hydrolase (TIGR01509 family)